MYLKENSIEILLVALIQSNLSSFGKISRKCGVHYVFSMDGGKFYYMALRSALMCRAIEISRRLSVRPSHDSSRGTFLPAFQELPLFASSFTTGTVAPRTATSARDWTTHRSSSERSPSVELNLRDVLLYVELATFYSHAEILERAPPGVPSRTTGWSPA